MATELDDPWFHSTEEEPLIYNQVKALFSDPQYLEGRKKLEKYLSSLMSDVTARLVSTYDYTLEAAEEAVSASLEQDADMWHSDADVSDLAKYLAESEDDE